MDKVNAGDKVIKATVVDYAFDSKNAVQYCPKWEVEFNLTTKRVYIPALSMSADFDPQLFWLKTLGKRWVFAFDRANASSTALRMFFCKDCGQPFNKLNEIGTHNREFHNNDKVRADKAKADNDDELEAKLLAEAEAQEQSA